MSDQHNEPALVLTYAPSGWGKTVDNLYSFPDAIFIAAPGALKPWRDVVGLPYEPAHAPKCRTIPEATAFLLSEAQNKKRRFTAVVCDDWSLMCDASFAVVENQFPKGGIQFWGGVRRMLLDFREAARDAGLHIILNAHERGPHNDDKKGYVRGGPMLPGTMPEDFPKSCDMVLRVKKEPSYPIWPFIYSAREGDDDWVEKDRHGFVPPATKIAPMNLGEVMRRGFGMDGPFGIRRPRGLEWMEKVVEQIATKIAGTTPGTADQNAILLAFKPLIESKYAQHPLHIQWVFRDAIARAALRDAHARDRFSWLSSPAVVTGTGEL